MHDSEPLSDPSDKGQSFNSYFNSIFTIRDFVLPPSSQLLIPSVQLSFISMDLSDVYKALCLLDCSKAPRLDNISPDVLRLCADPLFTPVLQSCLQSCTFPNEWKTHEIVPIPKGSNKSSVQNYIPPHFTPLCAIKGIRTHHLQ